MQDDLAGSFFRKFMMMQNKLRFTAYSDVDHFNNQGKEYSKVMYPLST